MTFTASMVEAAEAPLRFTSGEASLYGMWYEATGPCRGGVLLCPADGEERVWTLRTSVHFARRLARAGFAVLRFDYTGHGESTGTYQDTSVRDRVRDITAAVALLRSRIGGQSPVVVAPRLGAALALEAAAGDAAIDKLVLWEPVLDTDGYVRNLFRINLATQMVIHKKVVRTTDDLLADMEAGKTVSANGYQLSKAFVDDVAALRPAERLQAFGGAALVVCTPPTRLPESPATVVRHAMAPFWKEPKGKMPAPVALLSSTAEWIEAQANGRAQ